MSMRYFTLSTVCMLIFSMLLALSGTTDFPAGHHDIVSPAGVVSPVPGPSRPGNGEAIASMVRPPQDPESRVDTGNEKEAMGGVARNRPLLLIGIVLVAAWVLLSFRFFSSAKS